MDTYPGGMGKPLIRQRICPTTNWAEAETTEYERPERKQIRVTAGEAEGLVTLNVSKAGPYLLQKSESADFCVFGKEIVIKCC